MNLDDESKISQVQTLIETALSNKHSEVEQINNINEYFAAKALARGLYKLKVSFSTEANRSYREYITGLKNRVDNVQLLFDYRTLKQCEQYYHEEYFNVWSSIKEYRDYLSSSNLIRSVFGHDRRDDDNE